MKALKWPVLAALGWILLLVAVGVLHTEVLMKGRLIAEEDERISYRYGQLWVVLGVLVAGPVALILSFLVVTAALDHAGSRPVSATFPLRPPGTD